MRILLVQTAQGLTPSSGGYKANISLLRNLQALGHASAQICYAHDGEVEIHAKRAEEKGIKPNVTYSVSMVPDANDIEHELSVMTFSDEDQIHNVVISRRQFNTIYPRREF